MIAWLSRKKVTIMTVHLTVKIQQGLVVGYNNINLSLAIFVACRQGLME
jgi:hypothetical protein